MCRPRLPDALCALVLLAAPAATQGAVWIVDDDGGAGVDATDVQAALALAADGDVILVRDGTYPAFTAAARALVVAADAGARPVLTGTCRVENLTGAQSFVLRGLELVPDGPVPGQLDLRTSLGPIWVEDVQAEAAGAIQCDATAWMGGTLAASGVVSGLRTFDARAAVYDLTVQAGDGADGFVDDKLGIPLPGGQGGHGLRCDGADEVFVSGGLLAGGDGGDGLAPDPPDPCSAGGPGGSGLAVFSEDALVRRLDTDLVAGAGGQGGAGCPDGAAGTETLFLPAGNEPLVELDGSAHRVTSNGPVREGGTLALTFEGEPGDTVFVLWSPTQGHQFLQGSKGVLVVGAPLFVLPATFTLPGSGTLMLPATLPELGPGVASVVLYVGASFVSARTGKKTLGSATAVILLDAGV